MASARGPLGPRVVVLLLQIMRDLSLSCTRMNTKLINLARNARRGDPDADPPPHSCVYKSSWLKGVRHFCYQPPPPKPGGAYIHGFSGGYATGTPQPQRLANNRKGSISRRA
ncbi:hypothetical protein RSOLAG1IB_00514 [Rhizoctonia solani AG-1 IB]|uniref:Uncharacterized protein n=1 Tax=Thanatephorus cucumeris (strain AG1-IB / isolate 7/3/14) TaxID=1108050 RepID=A0A0B7F6X7_THACB|nr:hypothetical protein RSOLAG1IB_00514 [Rhizoctonia solani AG-1 IB]